MAFVQSAGFTLLSFALVISVVVFFHELGHLLVGKAVGVKAIRFSIGFGPRLFGFTAGETEYRVSLLPLGGYVKFAGDNPYEEVAPQDRGRGFLEQPPWKKGVIAFAGPAANFALAVALYFVVFAAPHQDLAAKVGYVKPQSPAPQAGLRAGDRIARIDGEPVEGWSALQEKIRAHAGQPLTMEVERNDARETLRIVPAVHEETNPIETVKHGRIGISAVPRAAQVTVVSPDLPASRAGLHTFDKVVKLDRSPIASCEQLQLQITVRRDGKELIATVTPHLRKDRDETGVLQDVPDLGAAPDLNAFADAERIWVRYTLPDAARRAVGNTAGFVRAQAIGIVRIVTGHISSRAIGGPLMIADVARKAAENGWRELIVTMGAISVVLGLMNLIPVPGLDGFHVLTAFIEAIRRRPLSVRFREVAHAAGIALLLTLMLYAFRNDAMRKWFE